jgi:alpha-mannosidase
MESDAAQPAPEGAPEAADDAVDQWSLIALIPNDGQEPPAARTDADADAIWAAVTALWHPALLALATDLPRVEDLDFPNSALAREVRIAPAGMRASLPSGYETAAADIGAIVIGSSADRWSIVRALVERLHPTCSAIDENDPTALDFFALGTARWFLKDLTIGMGHVDCLDSESLRRETLAGARAWRSGDPSTAAGHLRAGFEILTQARERFYPVDSYIVDLCLIDAGLPAGALAEPLSTRAAISLVASAQAISRQAELDPDRVEAIRRAVDDGWLDVIGGMFAEVDEPLLPLESILWQFRKGAQTYRKHLDERTVETLAQRRFALYPQRPQLARRFAFRFALHMAFDAGRFPVRAETKRLWESPDGTSIESLVRPPLGADRPSQGLLAPWRLARSMKEDHVATLPLVHWPKPVSGWYRDWRRAATFSPVLGRWVTAGDFFGFTDRPYETFTPTADEYVLPYLAQAVARKSPSPIAHRALHRTERGWITGLGNLSAIASALSAAAGTEIGDPPLGEIEDALETGGLSSAPDRSSAVEAETLKSLATVVGGSAPAGRSGFLVFNPLGIARRATVLLPDAHIGLRAEGPLRAAQLTEEGVWGVVDLPAFGYAWVPEAPLADAPPPQKSNVGIDRRVLRNEYAELEVDEATGGIRSIKGPGEATARLGQQLVIAGPKGSSGPVASRMVAKKFEADYGGPALVQAQSAGSIVDASNERVLADFAQQFRLWSGRPILELVITLSNLDADWLRGLGESDPWENYLACRWAWPDPNSTIRRTLLLHPQLTEAARPETPEAIDISTRRQRTAIFPMGLAHHRRHGSRMLDTLLVAGEETQRSFRMAVALDLEHPFHAVLDLETPAVVVPTQTGPPQTGVAGWFFNLDHKAVAITRLESLANSGDGRGWGAAFHLLETAGNAARCRLSCFRPPVWARQTDFNGETVVDLAVDGDAVLIDLTPNELARVDVTLG